MPRNPRNGVRAGSGHEHVRYRHIDGQMYDAYIVGGTIGGPYDIHVPSLKPAGAGSMVKSGIAVATARNQTNVIFKINA